MVLKVGYAYAHSAHAANCGASMTGCYIVERTHNVRTGRDLASPVLAIKVAFNTEEKAITWASKWPEFEPVCK
jgi:hypothetical protein